ncbi:MAG: response regulator [Rhodospirillales bacterium]|nr:response regulator [Rhodospirillales bacterium]
MAEYDLSNLSILIVDDSAPMRSILRSVMREFSVSRTLEAANGRQALDILEKSGADLVIADYQMAPVDGLELTKAIRMGSGRIDPYIPVIVVSAYTETHYIFAARDAGVNEFLAKPISANHVYFRIRSVIEHPRPFVQAKEFFGPDRRRRDVIIEGPNRRGDNAEAHDDGERGEMQNGDSGNDAGS